MKYLFLAFFYAIAANLCAQTREIDQERYETAIDWLNSKLNYIYFDEEDQRWWRNTFYANEDKVITMKHIASDLPNTAHLQDKTYTIRRFQIQDIDPNSLKVTDVSKSRGRIVKGRMLELRTFGFQNLIEKTINNRPASSTSFLFISFPTALTDSLANYAEIVKEKFSEAITASTQIYPSDYEHDVERVLKILTGEFQTEAGSIWKTTQEQPHVLRLERENGNTEYFGYDTKEHRFYFLTLTAQGLDVNYYRLSLDTNIRLEGESPSDYLEITNQNSFLLWGNLYFRK